MNSEQIALVQNTFDMVKPISETAADLFYNRLFELDLSLKTLFKTAAFALLSQVMQEAVEATT